MLIEYQGTVVSRPEYSHVGYLSAAAANHQVISYAHGTFLLVCAAVLGTVAVSRARSRRRGFWGNLGFVLVAALTAGALVMAGICFWSGM